PPPACPRPAPPGRPRPPPPPPTLINKQKLPIIHHKIKSQFNFVVLNKILMTCGIYYFQYI
ncbi:hypothetical protein, partial [Peptoanaerobacter stomatis]